ncbi:MAG TPA: recombinase family protein [Bacteriovoracaceae bacterium]|nr:recombinase family protein [Bacteriovoracaceae bacterium]
MARKYGKQTAQGNQGELALQDVTTALYIRVSTIKQAEEGSGLDAQRSELNRYCLAQGWTVDASHVYIDAGISGKTDDRPAFQAMLAAAQAGQVQRVVATKLDRIARNLKNLLQTVEELRKAECGLVVIKEKFDTSTAQGVFVMQMLGAVSELERSMIHDRVHAGRFENVNKGKYNGSRCPLGYIYENKRFVATERAELVRAIFAMWNSGQSLNAIVRTLSANNEATPTGKGAWCVKGVKHILANGAYAGVAQWSDEEANSASVPTGKKNKDGGDELAPIFPTLIDTSTYEAAQARLKALTRGKRVDLAGEAA